MNDAEITKATNLARRIIMFNAEAKHYMRGNIFVRDMDKIKELIRKREKLNTIIKMYYPKSEPENFLYDDKKDNYVNDIDIVMNGLIGNDIN